MSEQMVLNEQAYYMDEKAWKVNLWKVTRFSPKLLHVTLEVKHITTHHIVVVFYGILELDRHEHDEVWTKLRHCIQNITDLYNLHFLNSIKI
jgi:hypothetical protein